MRIIYVSTRSDAIGGSNVHIRDVAKAAAARGHEVHVLGGGEGPFARDIVSNGLPYHPLRHVIREIQPLRDQAAVWELRSLLRRLRPDLVSLHTAKAGAIGRLAALRTRVPVVYTPHGWTFTPGMPSRRAIVYTAVERLVAPLARRIVDVCEFERTIALERRVGHAEQHVVIHNGVHDTSPEHRSGQEADVPVLTMVARFEAPKDHTTLFHALASCRGEPWSLDLIGDGPEEPQARRLASELDLADRVRFLGARNDVADRLARSQVFVLSTRWEGFPRSVLEAMRAGLPVVASRVGGVHEAVLDGTTGFVVPPGDADALAERIGTLLRNSDLRARFGEAGRARYERSFTFEQMFERTLRLYSEVTGVDV